LRSHVCTDCLPNVHTTQLRGNGALCRAVYACSKPGQQLARQTDRDTAKHTQTHRERERETGRPRRASVREEGGGTAAPHDVAGRSTLCVASRQTD